MISIDQIDTLTGHTVLGADGEKIGKVGEVYLDDASGKPEWVTVNTGLFGSSHSFAPLADASVVGDDLQIAHSKDVVKDAPRVGDDSHLSPAEEEELYRYYHLADNDSTSGGRQDSVRGDARQHGTGTTGTGTTGTDTTGTDTTGTDTTGTDTRGTGQVSNAGRRDRSGEAGVVGHDTSGPTTDDAMTRSEEELTVGTRTREAGRARLRKHVVTERQSVTVPVSHEEVRLEREPITEGNYDSAMGGAAISEEEHELVLHEEVPVVSTETHAVERVRLGTQTVTEQQTVTEDVRKEQIEMDSADSTDATTSDTARGGKGTARKH